MDGSDCRGYRTTRRNLPSSIAYRPPFTAISRNIGVIDMQTSHTTASAAATTSLARRIVAASWKPVLFAVLIWTCWKSAPMGYLCGGVALVAGFLKYRKIVQYNSLTVKRFRNTYKDHMDVKKFNKFVDTHF